MMTLKEVLNTVETIIKDELKNCDNCDSFDDAYATITKNSETKFASLDNEHYNYKLACDKKNNTPDLVDNKEILVEARVQFKGSLTVYYGKGLKSPTGVTFNWYEEQESIH
jgi:hypothetical protein